MLLRLFEEIGQFYASVFTSTVIQKLQNYGDSALIIFWSYRFYEKTRTKIEIIECTVTVILYVCSGSVASNIGFPVHFLSGVKSGQLN
jgi:hypothetical protein